MKDSVLVVIPNFNGASHIADCLKSLGNQTSKPDVVVVDNGSSDDSVTVIQKKFPSVYVIELDKNYGFTGGVNKGMELAIKQSYKYVALFNSDAVAEKEWIENLVSEAEKHPQVGIVTGKLMRSDKKHIDSTGQCLSTWGMPFPRGRNEIDQGQYDNQNDIFGATGGASLYRVAMLKKIGLTDQDFFLYLEDVDLSFRAQLAGWRVRYKPEAIAYHQIGATSSKLGNITRYHSVKNFAFLYLKNMPFKLYFKYALLVKMYFLAMFGSSILKGFLLTFLKSWAVAIFLTPKMLFKRRKIQSTRKVSVKYIDSMLYHHLPPKPPRLGKV